MKDWKTDNYVEISLLGGIQVISITILLQIEQAQKLGKDTSENPNILNNKFWKINNQKFLKYFEKSKEYFKAN